MDYEMGFEFGIYTEIDENGKKSYFEHLTGLDNNETGEVRQWPARLNSEHTVIPYSDTAYQFFLNLAAGFEKMVHQLAEFFGEEDGQKVISFIQSHPKLLGSGQ